MEDWSRPLESVALRTQTDTKNMNYSKVCVCVHAPTQGDIYTCVYTSRRILRCQDIMTYTHEEVQPYVTQPIYMVLTKYHFWHF